MTISVTEILQHPATEAFGWTLIHSIWQGFFLWTLLQVVAKWVPESEAKTRYAIATTLLAGLPIMSLATYTFLLSNPSLAVPPSITGFQKQFLDWLNYSGFVGLLEEYISWLVPAWIFGAIVFSTRLWFAWGQMSLLKKDALEVVDHRWTESLRELAVLARVSRPVVLAETRRLTVPVVIGYMKPMILVPLGMLSSLSPEQVETILLHELAHIRRNDFLINIIQSIAEVIYFFNPFAWWISSSVRKERECCCDDEVVSQRSARVYAGALVNLEESRLQKQEIALALADDRFALFSRIKRITGNERRASLFAQTLTAFSFGALFLISVQAIAPLLSHPSRTQATSLPVDVGSSDATYLSYENPSVVSYPEISIVETDKETLNDARTNQNGKKARPLRQKHFDVDKVVMDITTSEPQPKAVPVFDDSTEQLVWTTSADNSVEIRHDRLYPGVYQTTYVQLVNITQSGRSTTTFTSWTFEQHQGEIHEKVSLEIKVNLLLIKSGKRADFAAPVVNHI